MDGKGKAPAVGRAYMVGMIENLPHPITASLGGVNGRNTMLSILACASTLGTKPMPAPDCTSISAVLKVLDFGDNCAAGCLHPFGIPVIHSGRTFRARMTS
jgi:hypothetical protein